MASDEIKKFDFQSCPFCGCEFDLHQDHYWDWELKYPHCTYLFKCHSCHTVYGVAPVVAYYEAKRLERGKPLALMPPLIKERLKG
jgi:hypothetical protein